MAITPKIRMLVLRRDYSRCRLCGATSEQSSLEVDHWVPRALGGTDDLDNLVTLCRDCNRGKGKMFFGRYMVLVREGALQPSVQRSAIRPPLAYQLDALRQLLAHFRMSGVTHFTVFDLGQCLSPGRALRDGVNPVFEPLSLATVAQGFDALLESGEVLRCDGDDDLYAVSTS